MNAAQRRAAKRRGFTMIELMIAMTTGLFVISAAYYISRTSSRMFREQLRRSETQMSLRSAMEMIRRDVSRAGFSSVRGTAELPGCAGSALGNVGAGLQNVSPVNVGGAFVLPDPSVASRQMLFISGNLTTGDQFPVIVQTPQPDGSINLDPTSDAFLRNFVHPAPATPNFMPGRFEDAFLPNPATPGAGGRMISYQDLQTRRIFLRAIGGITAPTAVPAAGMTAPSVQFTPNLPFGVAGGGCLQPRAALVAPVATYRYAIESTTTDPELELAANSTDANVGAMLGGDVQRFALVRREIDMTTVGTPNPAPIPGTARIVLDFLDPVAGFRVEALWNNTPGNDALTPQLALSTNPTQVTVPPETIRSLRIQLVVQSAERSDAAGSGGGAEMYRAIAGRRFARFEVFLPNHIRNPSL